MKRTFTISFFFSLIIVLYLIGMNENNEEPHKSIAPTLEMKEKNEEDKAENLAVPAHSSINDREQFTSMPLNELIGKTAREIESLLGKADRKDPTPYGYAWWIYDNSENYYQVGMNQNKVVAVYGIGPSMELRSIKIGQTRDEIEEILSLKKEVEVVTGEGSFLFTLTNEDYIQRPLVKLDDSIVMQLYFDSITDRLSSVRLLTNEVLLLHRPYNVSYSGRLPELPLIMDDDWPAIEYGMERQIHAISNQIRSQFNKERLVWDELTAGVAFRHSKDMAVHNYFSHISLDGDGLEERLIKSEIQYASAGENIAAQYPDAPAVVEGWLNSEGHREALLNENYTHLGVGVYRYYYTQNFLEQPY
ncbi:CAP domain-containing protein [Pontibacillus salipaludis]|uniref:CAP domain-containing protein n=1 Tax=Pontibacillus salipaludis TaxID=1697394 RepID=UPI0031EAB5B6